MFDTLDIFAFDNDLALFLNNLYNSCLSNVSSNGLSLYSHIILLSFMDAGQCQMLYIAPILYSEGDGYKNHLSRTHLSRTHFFELYPALFLSSLQK